MIENFYVFKAKYKRDNYVVQNKVAHKLKIIHFRPDLELETEINELAKELGQTKSKIIKDILRDFFLDQKLKRQKFELSDIC